MQVEVLERTSSSSTPTRTGFCKHQRHASAAGVTLRMLKPLHQRLFWHAKVGRLSVCYLRYKMLGGSMAHGTPGPPARNRWFKACKARDAPG